jgi:hypothetical protein
MAAFQEVFRRSGIDERRSPPGMVVPFGGANIVALIDPGRKLKVEHRTPMPSRSRRSMAPRSANV